MKRAIEKIMLEAEDFSRRNIERIVRTDGPTKLIVEPLGAFFASNNHERGAFSFEIAMRMHAQISHGHFDSMVSRCIAPKTPFVCKT
jgi:hypothetical protein